MNSMTSNLSLHGIAQAAAALVLVLAPALSPAQTIYRIVEPDGRIIFSDRPPAANAKATILGADGRSNDNGAATTELPFELRQAISKYPVMLYTGDNCEPCNAGRSLLRTRGIPFTERTITTAKDVEALQAMGSDATVPILSIGSQRLKGFSGGEWNDYLSAAGYPQNSLLPPGYRNPPAAPLVPLPEAAPPTAQPAPPPVQDTAPPPPPVVTPENPAGIIF
jgi:glutaredoxin